MSTVGRWAARDARVESAYTNADCPGRIEGILLQQCRIEAGATRWPTNDEVSADGIGEANAVRGSSGSGCSAKRCRQNWGDEKC